MAKFTAAKDSEHYRTYYLRVPVRSYFWEAVRGELIIGRRNRPTPTVLTELGVIKGVQSFYVHEGYEVIIHKANSYEWTEFSNEIAEALDKHDTTAKWPEPEELDIPEYTPEIESEYDEISAE